MKEIIINDKKYQVVIEQKDSINLDILKEKVTDYFDDYDYIVGDWAYGKLRLKGFNDKNNKNCKPLNDISNLEKYIKESCAHGCKWFQIKKIKD